MDTSSSHHKQFTTFVEKVKKFLAKLDAEDNIASRLKEIGYENVPNSVLKSYKNYLDNKALSLVGNNDAYYRNRLQSWSLVNKIK